MSDWLNIDRSLAVVAALTNDMYDTVPPARQDLLVSADLAGVSGWGSVVDAVRRRHLAGQPVLVGTRSILASEQLSAWLARGDVPHQILNAKQDTEEASIVANAGMRGRVTIATNMAGRGTDIKLGPGVAELGGLHVILTEGHDNTRVDRQLAGRCARQGDRGSWQAMICLEDEVALQLPRILRRVLMGALEHAPRSPVLQRVATLAYWFSQRGISRRHSAMRRRLMRADDDSRRALSFGGTPE